MKIRYLHTNLHIAASYDLLPLVYALEAQGFWALSVGQRADGRYAATLQATPDYTDPDVAITMMLFVLASLEGAARDLWVGCSLREFEIGYACGDNPLSLSSGLAPATLLRVTEAGAGLRIRLHTANVPVQPRNYHAPPPTKRIVSMREYIGRIGKREAKRWGSLAMAVAVGVCAATGIICVLGAMFSDGTSQLGFGVGALISLPVAWRMKKFAEKTMQEALVQLDVVPLTRANVGDLSPSDSLVRASQEPASTQQTELLRAAQYDIETPPEELLRAAQTHGQG